MPLRRVTPFLVGAVAAVIWLRRRRAGRPALPARPEPAAARPPEHAPVDIVTVVDDLLAATR